MHSEMQSQSLWCTGLEDMSCFKETCSPETFPCHHTDVIHIHMPCHPYFYTFPFEHSDATFFPRCCVSPLSRHLAFSLLLQSAVWWDMSVTDRGRRSCRGVNGWCLHLQMRPVTGDERGQTWGVTWGQRPLVRMQHV